MDNVPPWLQHWLRGIRLYLGVGIAVVTAEVWWWAAAVYGSGTALATTRTQEIYAWLSLVLLAATLLIGPVTKLLPRLPGKQQIRESRRMVGISAGWFALLHAGLTYLSDYRGSSLLQLPSVYKQALLLGVIGLVALLLLAITSADWIMKILGIWWFRLHRLVYVAALAGLMHAFMVGAHATTTPALIALGMVAAAWIGCNLYLLLRDPHPGFWKLLALGIGTILLLAVLDYGLVQHWQYNAVISEHKGHE